MVDADPDALRGESGGLDLLLSKIFPKRGQFGATDFDADDTLSVASWQDLSGGTGISVIKPSTDMGKTWWHVADLRGTDGWTCPGEVIASQPDTFSGDHVPVGRIGTSTYGLWGTELHRWVPESQTWTDSEATIGTVVNPKGIVSFNGSAWFPLGSSGYVSITESAPRTLDAPVAVTGAATPTSNDPEPTSNPRVWAFAVHQQMLWAITTAAEGHALCNSVDGATNNWFWEFASQRGTAGEFVKIETGAEPKLLFEFVNTQLGRALWCSTRRGCLIYDPGETTWQESNLWDVPPHPDFGIAAKVFRPGEAAWISGGGGDLIQYQASGVVVPASGPGGAGDGMPAGKRGSVVSMATDLANLWLLVQGETAVGESDPILEDSSGSDLITLPASSGTTSVIAWTGKGFHPQWEQEADAGATASTIVVSDALTDANLPDYRTFWGVGEWSYSMESNLNTYSSRQAAQIGTRRFATNGYIELGEYFGTSLAVRKLASHASLFMHTASADNYMEYEYRTDADSLGVWHTLGAANTAPARTIFPFGLTDDEQFSEGLAFNWIASRVRFTGSGGIRTPVGGGLSLAFMPLPQDAATKTYTIGLPQDIDPITHLTREKIINKLEAHVESERFLILKHLERTYRAYVAGVAETGIMTRDGWGSLNLTLIQIPTGLPTLIGEG